MKNILYTTVALLAIALLSGCAAAAFNRVDMTMHRNITFGQELLDLQAAHEKGVINDTEYAEAKKNILSITSQLGNMELN